MTNTETRDAEGKRQETVPMVKEPTVKDDGRFLFYYTFPSTDNAVVTAKQEDKNV